MPRIVLVALVLFAATGCSMNRPKAQISHVVVAWLKNPGDEAARQRIIDETEKFRQIPGVVDITIGRPVPSTRPVVDSTWDIAAVITFKDEAYLRAYDEHPIHKKAVSEVSRPLTAKVLIYDIRHDAGKGRSLTPR